VDIDQGGGLEPGGLAPATGGQGVGGLARLADGDGQRPRRQGRVAIAELRGDLDVAGQAGQLLEQVAADLAGVEGGAAGDDLDPVDLGEVDLRRAWPDRSGVEVVGRGCAGRLSGWSWISFSMKCR
jgi:hypothetical protein